MGRDICRSVAFVLNVFLRGCWVGLGGAGRARHDSRVRERVRRALDAGGSVASVLFFCVSVIANREELLVCYLRARQQSSTVQHDSVLSSACGAAYDVVQTVGSSTALELWRLAAQLCIYGFDLSRC